MRSPRAHQIRGDRGYYTTVVTHPDGRSIDITMFRGVPTLIDSMSLADPFGPATAAITLGRVTSFDTPGAGDLWWYVPWAKIDISWISYEPDTGARSVVWVWEGLIASEEITDPCQIQLKGALYGWDNILAAPWYPQQPIPYEHLIRDRLDPGRLPALGTSRVKIEFPDDWTTRVPEWDRPEYLNLLRPYGVQPKEKWSGLVSRSTGSWEPTLTGYIQTLLSVMFTADGDQWTLDCDPGRVPVLRVRRQQRRPNEDTLVVHNGSHGVAFTGSKDWTQASNCIFGVGKDLAGTEFSGANVSPDGLNTWYEPYATLPQVWPVGGKNPYYNEMIMRKESRITFPQGTDELSSTEVAMTQLQRSADPGIVGTINLDTDPLLGGLPFPRQFIRPGRTILVKGLRGTDVLFHINRVDITPEGGSVSLQVDTRYRDALTTHEVRARTRDALDPVNLLQIGKYSVTIQDMLRPWSYAAGSGCIPSGGERNSKPLFDKMPSDAQFPWEPWTKMYPPKDNPQFYIRIDATPPEAHIPADTKWQVNGEKKNGVPVLMAQNGTIRLTQIAAYDRDGNVLPVRFHFALYANESIGVIDMPMVPGAYAWRPYKDGERYPFFPGAFEQRNPDGSETDNPGQMLPQGADLVIGWGNHFEPAGYSPGLYSAGAAKTGMLVDEAPWQFDTSNQPGFDRYSAEKTSKNDQVGRLYAMAYCDDYNGEVYLLGRCYNAIQGV